MAYAARALVRKKPPSWFLMPFARSAGRSGHQHFCYVVLDLVGVDYAHAGPGPFSVCLSGLHYRLPVGVLEEGGGGDVEAFAEARDVGLVEGALFVEPFGDDAFGADDRDSKIETRKRPASEGGPYAAKARRPG